MRNSIKNTYSLLFNSSPSLYYTDLEEKFPVFLVASFIFKSYHFRMITGIFVKRINRFMVEVKVNDKLYLSHLPNSGRLLELLEEGREVSLELGKGKLPFKLTGVKIKDFWVSVDSLLVNRFFREVLSRKLKPFLEWRISKREYKYGGSRMDFLLEKKGERMLVEVKSSTLVENGIALFPDAPTKRGTRHLRDLLDFVTRGNRASLLIVIQRPDADKFAPNSFIDYDFALEFYRGILGGVEVYQVLTRFSPEKGKLNLIGYRKLKPLEVLLNEFNFLRYPEVQVEMLRGGKKPLLKFKGTSFHSCCFDENIFDLIYMAEDRGFNMRIGKLVPVENGFRVYLELYGS
jgi:sugar fermentation stimulation protein A